MSVSARKLPYDGVRACRELAASDARLRRLIERAGPLTLQLRPTRSTFEALLESITHQQLHGNAARAIHGRVLDLFPARRPSAKAFLALPEPPFRGAGLSASKLAAIRDLAEKCDSGIVPPFSRLGKMPDDEICERLTTVRGIGVWTVHMLLIFRLGRPDVLPTGDYGVRKGFALTMGTLRAGDAVAPSDLPKAAAMERRAARWQGWRSVASWYLWRACDLAAQQQSSSTRQPA